MKRFSVRSGMVFAGTAIFLTLTGFLLRPGGHCSAVTVPATFVPCIGYVDAAGDIRRVASVRPGRISKVHVKEGDRVRAGDILIEMEDDLVRARLREAEAAQKVAQMQFERALEQERLHPFLIAQQRSAVEAAERRHAAARLQQEKLRRLKENHLIDEDEVGAGAEALLSLAAIGAAEKSALARLEASNPALTFLEAKAVCEMRSASSEQVRSELRQCVVRAPVDGSVVKVEMAAGEHQLGLAANAAIVICPVGERIVRAEVPEECANLIEIGQRVELSFSSEWSDIAIGEIERVGAWHGPRRIRDPHPLQREDDRVLECIVKVETKRQLMLGQKLSLKIEIGNRSISINDGKDNVRPPK